MEGQLETPKKFKVAIIAGKIMDTAAQSRFTVLGTHRKCLVSLPGLTRDL